MIIELELSSINKDIAKMTQKLDKNAEDILFNSARTHNKWKNEDVLSELLVKTYNLTKMGPTAANCQPLRVIFIKSREAKERLKPFLAAGNVEKTMSAPIIAILAYDTKFYEHLPFLFPHADARSWYEGDKTLAEETAFRNATLQAGYFIMAARTVGLDCGPMSGFDANALNKEFFPDGRFKVNFLCNLGYGDENGLFPRSPRFEFSDACEIL